MSNLLLVESINNALAILNKNKSEHLRSYIFLLDKILKLFHWCSKNNHKHLKVTLPNYYNGKLGFSTQVLHLKIIRDTFF